MFNKLRNKLVAINLGITTIVIVIAFSAIYLFSTNAARHRPPAELDNATLYLGAPNEYEDDLDDIIEDYLEQKIQEEKQAAASQLLLMLIISGIAIDVAVLLVSYLLAEEAIKPVREAYESQKVFIANASHEIKTPLAAIAANLEAADIRGNHWVDNIEKETEKLTSLNTELLSLARIDLQQENATAKEINLSKIIDQEIKLLQPRMGQIHLTLKMPKNKIIKVNLDDFKKIFNILMDNAIKYCDHIITISLDDKTLSISNDGKTIPKRSLPHIFERFYQADKSSDGVGLGLSIAKSLAERNSWKIIAESKNRQTTFKIVLN